MNSNRSAQPLGMGSDARLARVPMGDPIQLDSVDTIMPLGAGGQKTSAPKERQNTLEFAGGRVKVTIWHARPPQPNTAHDIKWIRDTTGNPQQIAFTDVSYDPTTKQPVKINGVPTFEISVEMPIIGIYLPSELKTPDKKEGFDEVLKHELEHVRLAFEDLVASDFYLGFTRFEYLASNNDLTFDKVKEVMDNSMTKAPDVITKSASSWDDKDLARLSKRLRDLGIYL